MAQAAHRQQADDTSGSGRLLIAGRWVDGDATAPVIDKYGLAPFADVHLASRFQVSTCVAAAQIAYRESRLDNHARGAILDRAAALIESRREEFIDILRLEAGFTRSDAGGEVRRCAATVRLSAEEARRFGGDVIPLEGAEGQGGRIGFTLRVPLGVVCAITPFNAPLNTVAHKIAPAIAAGNAVILKPSLHTPLSSCLLAEIFLDAGLPAGLISVLHGGPDVVQHLLDEPHVRFYAFTGSTEAGRAIQERAGLRRTQMELGSITHCILCADANLDKALPKLVAGGFRKAGQVCTSIQILLVERGILADVEERLAELVAELPYGDPADGGEGPRGARLAEAVGARLSQPTEQGVFWVPASTFTRTDGSPGVFPHTVTDRAKPGLIAVGADGRRFVNEAVSYDEFVRAQLAHRGAVPVWLVCDKRFVWKYGLGKVKPFARTVEPEVASGYLRRADTIADLARAIDVPLDELSATVSTFNEGARRGEDPEFGRGGNIYQRHLGDAEQRPNPCVAPIEEGPFYAVAVRPADLGMSAGIVTDPQSRVLRQDGSAIAGLYVCGNDMASVMEGAYPGPGITLGPAITFGWLAGRAAAEKGSMR